MIPWRFPAHRQYSLAQLRVPGPRAVTTLIVDCAAVAYHAPMDESVAGHVISCFAHAAASSPWDEGALAALVALASNSGLHPSGAGQPVLAAAAALQDDGLRRIRARLARCRAPLAQSEVLQARNGEVGYTA